MIDGIAAGCAVYDRSGRTPCRRKPRQDDGPAAFAVVWRKFRFAYTYVIRSHEFKGQDQPDRFGSVGLTFRF